MIVCAKIFQRSKRIQQCLDQVQPGQSIAQLVTVDDESIQVARSFQRHQNFHLPGVELCCVQVKDSQAGVLLQIQVFLLNWTLQRVNASTFFAELM
jgi:hypothetical protein